MGFRSLVLACIALLEGDPGPTGGGTLPALIEVDSESIAFAVDSGAAVPILVSAEGGRAMRVDGDLNIDGGMIAQAGVDLSGNGTRSGRIADPFDSRFATYRDAASLRLPLFIVSASAAYTNSIEVGAHCPTGDITLAVGCSTDDGCVLNRNYFIPSGDPALPSSAYCRADIFSAVECNITAYAVCLKGG